VSGPVSTTPAPGAPRTDRPAVRPARPDEAAAVAGAVRALLEELGATPPAREAMEASARAVIADPGLGAVLVAEADGALVGVLAASWPAAIHAGGAYGLIQDLWVAAPWRSRGLGADLVDAFLALAAARPGVARVEVGIPRDGFPALAATRRFYERCGFDVVGARMRRRTA
jgi:GNAT superfamily N-acetyltransferase